MTCPDCAHAALDQVLALKAPQLSLAQSSAPARISLKIRTLKAKLATITQRLDWVQVSALQLGWTVCCSDNRIAQCAGERSLKCEYDMLELVLEQTGECSFLGFLADHLLVCISICEPADQQSWRCAHRP